MKPFLWFSYLFLVTVLSWNAIQSAISFYLETPASLITGPSKEILGSFAIQQKKGMNLFEKLNEIPVEPISITEKLLCFLPASLSLMSLTAFTIIIYVFIRLRNYDRIFLILSVLQTLLLLLWFDLIGPNNFGKIFFILLPCLTLVNLIFIRKNFETQNKSVNLLFFLPIALALAILGLLGDTEFYFKFVGVYNFLLLANAIYLSISFFYFARKIEGSQSKRKVTLVLLTTLMSIFPWSYFSIGALFGVTPGPSAASLFFLPAGLPIIYLGFNLQMGKLYFETPINSTLLRFSFLIYFSFVVFFTGIYQILFNTDTIWVIFLLMIPLVLDPLRLQFYFLLNDYFRKKSLKFHDYIVAFSGTILNPIQIDSLVNRIVEILKSALNVRFAKLVIAEDEFANWRPGSQDILVISRDHPIWTQLKVLQTIKAGDHFTQASIGPVRSFLRDNKAFIIVPLKEMQGALIISDKINLEPMFSEEVDFLTTCAAQLQPLFLNYKAQIEKIQYVRKKREVELAGRVQRSLIPAVQEMGPATFYSYYKPSIGASGDYVDLIPINNNNFIVILGDVSGHGLGSSYIMALVRAMVRSLREVHKAPLPEIFKRLNSYLDEEYGGADFMTLLAIQVEKKRGYCELSIINAGQYPAVILYKDGRLERIGKSQRLLGVLSQSYDEEKISLKEPARLFLYSDGAFEVFNEESQMLGQKKLIEWIQISREIEPADQIEYIIKRLEDFASPEHSAPDDLSLISLEFTKNSFYQIG